MLKAVYFYNVEHTTSLKIFFIKFDKLPQQVTLHKFDLPKLVLQ